MVVVDDVVVVVVDVEVVVDVVVVVVVVGGTCLSPNLTSERTFPNTVTFCTNAVVLCQPFGKNSLI